MSDFVNKFDLSIQKINLIPVFYKNVFRSLYDNVFVMSSVNILFTLIINIPLWGYMQTNTHDYKINHHHNIYHG